MSLLRGVWAAIPDGAPKEWLRLVANNYSQRGVARFSRKNGAYVTETANFRIVTAEPAFGVCRLINQFEHRHRVRAGEVVIDAGAFNGILMSVFGAQVGPTGRVVAFEPDAISRQKALRNWELNGRPAHVEIIPAGLWDCETDMEFYQRGSLGSSVFRNGSSGHKVAIHTEPLDHTVARCKLERVDFVKMNIEGAEIKALQGAKQTIRRFKPHFAISSDHFVNGDFASGIHTCGFVEEILRGHGYAAETIRYGTEWVTYGMPPPA